MKRALGLAAVWLVVSSAALFSGCYGRNCEGGLETYGTEPGEGRVYEANRWESSPIDGKWLFFPRQRYYVFDIRELGGRVPSNVVAQLSAQEEPQKGGNFTIGAGNLALFSNASPNRIDVKNDSCSDYYLRLVVEVPPFPPTTGDAGISAVPEPDAAIVDATDQ